MVPQTERSSMHTGVTSVSKRHHPDAERFVERLLDGLEYVAEDECRLPHPKHPVTVEKWWATRAHLILNR